MTISALTLLCGMPRSGTTWIGKVFDSHPDTLYRHEPDSIFGISGLPLVADPVDTANYRQAIVEFVERLPAITHPKVAASFPVFAKRHQSAFRHGLACVSALAQKVGMSKWNGRFTSHAESATGQRNEHIAWKSIELTASIGTILRALPSSRGVWITRHPCAYVASVLRGERERKFEGSMSSADDYGVFDLLLETNTARRMGVTREALSSLDAMERLAWRWVLFNQKACDDLQAIGNWTRLMYEEMCMNPMGEARRLLDFAGLTWHPQTEDFVRSSTSLHTGGYYALRKDPVKAAFAWQRDLTRQQVDRILRIARMSPVGETYE